MRKSRCGNGGRRGWGRGGDACSRSHHVQGAGDNFLVRDVTCLVVGGDQTFVAVAQLRRWTVDLLLAAAVGSRSWQCGGNRSLGIPSPLEVAAMHIRYQGTRHRLPWLTLRCLPKHRQLHGGATVHVMSACCSLPCSCHTDPS